MLPILLMHLFDSQAVLGGKAALLMLHITTLLFGDHCLRDASSPPEVSPDQISTFKNANLHPHQETHPVSIICSPKYSEMWSHLTGT